MIRALVGLVAFVSNLTVFVLAIYNKDMNNVITAGITLIILALWEIEREISRVRRETFHLLTCSECAEVFGRGETESHRSTDG